MWDLFGGEEGKEVFRVSGVRSCFVSLQSPFDLGCVERESRLSFVALWGSFDASRFFRPLADFVLHPISSESYWTSVAAEAVSQAAGPWPSPRGMSEPSPVLRWIA